MAKAAKKSTPKTREKPLHVKGSFLDIVKAAVKHREKNTAKKNKEG
jgi:hypothetical protein